MIYISLYNYNILFEYSSKLILFVKWVFKYFFMVFAYFIYLNSVIKLRLFVFLYFFTFLFGY